MPLTQISRITHMSIIKRTIARWAWESERHGRLQCGHAELEYAHRIEKANKVFYCLSSNVAFSVKFSVNLGLYKSVILPVLLYVLNCAYQSRTDQRNFQRRVLKWVRGPHRGDYKAQLRLLNVLPLHLFFQLNDLLLLSKLYQDIEDQKSNLSIHSWNNRGQVTLKLNKTQSEEGQNLSIELLDVWT